MVKVFVGGIRHESNSFSSLTVSLEDFRIISSEELTKTKYVRVLKNSGVDVALSFTAYAPPAGLVEKEAYFELKRSLLNDLEKAGKVDGVFLDLHGAMEVKDLGSGELDLVKSIREIVGEKCTIAASFDLHGNIPKELAEMLDIIVAFRTAPHIDAEETRYRAAVLLTKCLAEKIETSIAIVKPPMLLPGEFFVTLYEPAASIMKMLPEIDSKPHILVSSLFVGCAWTDAPYATPSAVVVATKDKYSEALEASRKLAYEVWRRRREFKPDVEAGEPEEVLEKALLCREKPAVISDSGDNVTAGGAGDVPVMLELLIEKNVEKSLIAGFYDKEAFKKCVEAGVGAEVKLSLGGKIDKINGYPIDIKAKVLKLSSEAVLIRSGAVDIAVTSRRKAFTELEDYKALGIDPREYKIIVVKLGYLFSDIREIAAKAYMAYTPGFTCLKIEKLPYRRVFRPIYPLDKDFEWSP